MMTWQRVFDFSLRPLRIALWRFGIHDLLRANPRPRFLAHCRSPHESPPECRNCPCCLAGPASVPWVPATPPAVTFRADPEDATGMPGRQLQRDLCATPSGRQLERRHSDRQPRADVAPSPVRPASPTQHTTPRPASAVARQQYARPYAKAVRTAPRLYRVPAGFGLTVQDQERRHRRRRHGRIDEEPAGSLLRLHRDERRGHDQISVS